MTFWAVKEDTTGVSLIFAGNERADSPTARLRLQTDGSWLGRSLGTPGRVMLRLRSVESVYPSAAQGATVLSVQRFISEE